MDFFTIYFIIFQDVNVTDIPDEAVVNATAAVTENSQNSTISRIETEKVETTTTSTTVTTTTTTTQQTAKTKTGKDENKKEESKKKYAGLALILFVIFCI